jgi:hypothetical protein
MTAVTRNSGSSGRSRDTVWSMIAFSSLRSQFITYSVKPSCNCLMIDFKLRTSSHRHAARADLVGIADNLEPRSGAAAVATVEQFLIRGLGTACQVCVAELPRPGSRRSALPLPKLPQTMIALLCFFLTLFAPPIKTKSRLEAENAALRHQLIVLRRRVRGRVQLTNGDRLFGEQLSVQRFRFPRKRSLKRSFLILPLRIRMKFMSSLSASTKREKPAPIGEWCFYDQRRSRQIHQYRS